jgi:hypothetical protein
MKKIVVVHGVGSPDLGSVIGGVTGTDSQLYDKSSLSLNGITYPTLSKTGAADLTLIEVNWSDIKRPLSSAISIARNFVALLVAMLFLSQHWPADNNGRRLSFTALNRWFIEAVLAWAVFLPAYTALLAGATGKGRIIIIAIYCLFSIGFAIFGRGFSANFAFGFLWGAIYLLLGIAWAFYHDRGGMSQILTAISVTFYGACQYIIGVLLSIVAIEILCFPSGKKQTLTQRLARLSFAYIPVLTISIIGPIVMSLALGLMEKRKLDEWSGWFTRALFYDLATGEFVMAACVAAIGSLLMIGLVLYFKGPWSFSGVFARKWLGYILKASPVILFINGLIISAHSLGIIHLPTFSLNPLDVYTYSALRILPFMPFLIGPATIIIDVIGDVIFYILPIKHNLSIQKETQERLDGILAGLTGDNTVTKLVVLAHSQGSVISADVLTKYTSSRIKLITIGSPICSFYEEFVGCLVGGGVEKKGSLIEWVNLFRAGDYIGGSIQRAGTDKCIGPGGHVNYWNDPTVLQELL